MRRLAFFLVVVLALSACGASRQTAPETTSKQVQAAERAQIIRVWESFFSSKTPAAKKPALLQRGSKFASVIRAFASNPLAAHTSAKVSKVTLGSPPDAATRATVVYTIYIGSTPVVKNQTGVAVRAGTAASWQVGDESLCRLIEVGGTAPPQCTK